ncbi:multiple PDZ domain protein-like [Centruroides sculpturatus]|uniref:multiple PDZ domain protein-like n=1 Tax=Centruroides sculpturatus TaxID=218467 RepID=UPI000C6D0EED|nr:multiple PDZ domain protein-like [Centruroides sculpturatus]
MPRKLETEAASNNELKSIQKMMNGGTSNSIENMFKLSSEEWQNDDILSSEISDDKMQSWEELDIGPAPPPPPRTVSKALHYPQKYKLKKCKEDSEVMSINSNESQFDSDSETKTSLEMEDKDMNFESEYGYSIQEIQKKYGDIKDGEIIIVNLEKGPGGLGLSLAGNKDRHKMSVFVCGMHPNGNAARDGRICIGDELLEVNGIVMYGRCHLNASAMIKGITGSSYKIVLLRRKNALEEMAVKPLTQFPLCPNNEILEKYSQYRDVRLITVNKETLTKYTGKTMKPHTIGESLILPAATKMTSIMHGDNYGNELKTIPLSRDTVSRRISEMSRNIESEVTKCIQNSSVFALQLDKTTDITKMSQLIIYIRFIFNEDITETFLCCKSLKGKTTGEKIFEVINEYFEAKSLTWANCVAVCTDGAAALTGSNKGLRGLIQKVAPHMVFNHCMIHRQALFAKDMDEELHNILQDAAANLLKSIEGLVTLVVSNPHKSSTTSLISNENEDSLDAELPQNDNVLKTDIKKQEKISPPEPPPKPLHLSVKSPSTVAPTIPTSAGCLQHISTSKLSTTPKYKLLPMPPINIDDDALSSSSSSSQETINTQPNPKTCEIIPGQEVTIEICKEKMGLGLSIIGGFDTPLGVVMIHEIYPDGAAAVDGRLIPGDQIMEVNGEDLRTAKHDQAITALRQTPPVVRMVVYREAGLNHEDDLYDILEVELHKKSGRGLGLSIVGRKNGPGVFISEVVKGGIAEANGQLMQGDQILEVNLHDLKNSTQEHAAAILKTTMGKINMKIGRLKAGSRRSTSSSLSSPQLDDNTEMPVQCKNITLQRGPEGLGFSIVGGFNSPHGNLPIYIKNVFEKGAAAEEGSLQQGDQIVAVNNQSLQGMTHEEAVDILKNAKGTVILTVLK